MSRKITLPQSEAEKTLLDISGDQWSQYQDMFVPLEDSWLQDISQRQGDRQQGADIMGAEAANKYGAFENSSYDQAFANGIAPGSGAFLSVASDLANEKANAASSGMTSARNAETMDYYNQGIKALQYGEGVGGEGIGGISQSAARDVSTDRMNRSQNDFNKNASDQTRYAMYGLPGAVAGATAGYLATSKGGSSFPVQGPTGPTVKGGQINYSQGSLVDANSLGG
jgi:hypothetical protein